MFDDERAIANAGVMLPTLLAGRLGIEALVDLGERERGNQPGPQGHVVGLGDGSGADCIEDCAVLRVADRGLELFVRGSRAQRLPQVPCEDVAALVRARHPDMREDRVRLVLGGAAGNPFLLEELRDSRQGHVVVV